MWKCMRRASAATMEVIRSDRESLRAVVKLQQKFTMDIFCSVHDESIIEPEDDDDDGFDVLISHPSFDRSVPRCWVVVGERPRWRGETARCGRGHSPRGGRRASKSVSESLSESQLCVKQVKRRDNKTTIYQMLMRRQ